MFTHKHPISRKVSNHYSHPHSPFWHLYRKLLFHFVPKPHSGRGILIRLNVEVVLTCCSVGGISTYFFVDFKYDMLPFEIKKKNAAWMVGMLLNTVCIEWIKPGPWVPSESLLTWSSADGRPCLSSPRSEWEILSLRGDSLYSCTHRNRQRDRWAQTCSQVTQTFTLQHKGASGVWAGVKRWPPAFKDCVQGPHMLHEGYLR